MSDNMFLGDEKIIFRSKKIFSPSPKQITVKLGFKERLNKEQLGNCATKKFLITKFD